MHSALADGANYESERRQDFSSPGSDGTLPDRFVPWRWVVAYTVRPYLLSRLKCRQEYFIGASIVRSRPDNEIFPGYADLYQRARAILEGRATELACENGCQLHQRIVAHTWFRHGTTNLVR